MSDIAERYERVTAERYERVTALFTERVRAVPAGAWDNPSPCEGWTARDVVGHLTEWIPALFGSHGVEFPPVPSVADDPVSAWETVQVTIARALTDPTLASQQVATPFSTQSLAETVDMIVTGDVFTHTWDLARATGQSEVLDSDQLQRMLASVGAMPEGVLRAEGMFGPRIEVPPDADDQTRFLGYVGRRAYRYLATRCDCRVATILAGNRVRAERLPSEERTNLVVFPGDYGSAGAVDLYGLPPLAATTTTGGGGPPAGRATGRPRSLSTAQRAICSPFSPR